jgi:hypothetical protein
MQDGKEGSARAGDAGSKSFWHGKNKFRIRSLEHLRKSVYQLSH